MSKRVTLEDRYPGGSLITWSSDSEQGTRHHNPKQRLRELRKERASLNRTLLPIEKLIAHNITSAVTVTKVIEIQGRGTARQIPLFWDGCPPELGWAKHIETVCKDCLPGWLASGYTFGKVRDYRYSVLLSEKIKDRGW